MGVGLESRAPFEGMKRGDPQLYRESRQRGAVVDLSGRTQLVLTGPDRVRYLNGQVTSDVRKLSPGQTQMACVTTAKGKLCADVCIAAREDALIVDAEPGLREALLARLERYIVADDVTIEDATDLQALLHYIGQARPPVSETGQRAAARRFGRDGWDLRLPRDGFAGARESLLAGQIILDDILAELLRIEAGIPRWGCELDENTLPPEAALDSTHIDYHKGCYIGQEVISRLRSVGHVNRRLTGFVAADATASLEPGTPLFAAGADTPSIGVLTSTAYSFTFEKPIALGYLKRGSPAEGLFARPADAIGAPVAVTVRELPFVS
jgi:folate-binding protein YgfZ